MKYVIIGGAGFIGSHIVDALVKQKHEVIVVDNLISGSKDFIPKGVAFEWGDIRSFADLERIFKKYSSIDRVINLAAQPYIPKCFDDPMLFFETNAVGTLNVIMACEKYKVGKLLQYASAEEYGTQTGKISEATAIRPQSTYGVSKVASDYLIQVRFRESGVHAISLRQFNCYGERETHEYVIPEIIQQLSESNTVKLGNIKAVRDFLYVGDAAQYAIELLEKGEPGEIYNMGSEESITIENLALVIGKLMGHTEVKIEIDPAKLRPWDIEQLQSDNTKLYGVVEYRAKTHLPDGLMKTIKYFNDNGKKWHF